MGADSHNAVALKPGESMVKGTRPKCSRCGADMYLRRASTGPRQGHRFWGCGNFFQSDPRKKCSNTINISSDGTWHDSRSSSTWQPMGIEKDKPVYTYTPIKPKPKPKRRIEDFPRTSTSGILTLPDDSEEQVARKDEFVVTMVYIPTGKETETTVTEARLKLLLEEVDFEIKQIIQWSLTERVKYDVTERFITDEYLMRC